MERLLELFHMKNIVLVISGLFSVIIISCKEDSSSACRLFIEGKKAYAKQDLIKAESLFAKASKLDNSLQMRN